MALQDLTADARLATLADRAEIAALLDRYACALDDRVLETALPGLLTPDAAVGRPDEDHSGLSEVTRYLVDSLAGFGPTQHIHTNYLIDLDGDAAAIRANSFAACVLPESDELYTTGGVLTATAARTPYGWRLKSVTVTPTWEHTTSRASGKPKVPSEIGTAPADAESVEAETGDPESGTENPASGSV